jgi:hypothetical protein
MRKGKLVENLSGMGKFPGLRALQQKSSQFNSGFNMGGLKNEYTKNRRSQGNI